MNRNKIGLIAVAILSTAVYANTLKNSFQWDDENRIVKNVHIRFLKNIPNFFRPGYFNLYEEARGERYRPIRTITFALDFALWKNDPLGYHLTNMFFHAACSVLVWYFVFLITKSGPAASLSAVIFAVHPVHTESITYIKNRSDVLCAVFYLLSLLFFIKRFLKFQALNLAVSVFCFVLALLTKEMAATLPVVLALYIFLFSDDKNLKKTMIYWTVLFVYVIFRYVYLSGGSTLGGSGFDLITAVKTVADYVKLGFLPYPLVLDRTYVRPEFFSPEFLFSVLILLFFFGLLVKSSRQNKFFLLFVLVTLLPVSNFLLIKGREFAEQRFYIPSIGISAFIGIIFAKYLDKKYAKAVFAALILAFSYLTISRNSDYRDEITLWRKTSERFPSTRAFNNLGTAYWQKKYYSDAVTAWKRALELDGRNAEAYSNLGAASFELELYDAAVGYFNKTIEIEPWNYLALSNLGSAYSIRGDYKNALEIHKRAVTAAPWTASTHYNLGVTYFRLNDFDNAVKEFGEALSWDPFHWQSYLRLSEIFGKFGKKDRAAEFLEKSQKIKIELGQ